MDLWLNFNLKLHNCAVLKFLISCRSNLTDCGLVFVITWDVYIFRYFLTWCDWYATTRIGQTWQAETRSRRVPPVTKGAKRRSVRYYERFLLPTADMQPSATSQPLPSQQNASLTSDFVNLYKYAFVSVCKSCCPVVVLGYHSRRHDIWCRWRRRGPLFCSECGCLLLFRTHSGLDMSTYVLIVISPTRLQCADLCVSPI